MLTDAQKKAVRETRKRMVERGDKRVTIWLGPDDQAKLAELVLVHGTPTQAIRQAIRKAASE